MRTSQELDHLREQAVMLRRQGKSRTQIKEILGPMSNATLNDALKNEPPPEWTRRPRARDDVRSRARELRGQGMDYEEIAAALGVSKSSVSLWVRDLPIPARLSYAECRQRSAEGARRYWAAERPAREALRSAVRQAAAAQIGDLTDRELLIAGAIAYWCEGAKSKPHRRSDRVAFINSDPDLIRFFLRFLDATGTTRTSLSFRIYIHENADADAAQRFWLEITEAMPDQFLTPVLKRHHPKTIRKKVGDDYHGCLRIDVYRGADLYRKIEGWAAASMAVRRATDRTEVDGSLPSKSSDTVTGCWPVS
jgi:transcriptional regulator with XRE-family HTH domain